MPCVTDAGVEGALAAAERRLHIVEAVLLGVENWERVFRAAAAAADWKAAISAVSAAMQFDEIQATAVLDIQFRRVTQQDVQRLREELLELREEIATLRR